MSVACRGDMCMVRVGGEGEDIGGRHVVGGGGKTCVQV